MTIQPMHWYARLDKAETDVKVLKGRIKDLQDAIMEALRLMPQDEPAKILRQALLGELSAIAQEDE